MQKLTIIAAAFILQACTLQEPGNLTAGRAQVKEHKFYQKTALENVDQVYLNGLSHHYNKHGDGPIDITTVYDPAISNARAASNKSASIIASLNDNGIHNLRGDILPVSGQSALIVSYGYYTAHAPKDCTTMPGYDDTSISAETDYRLGCTVETLIARQIARPKDLLGQTSSDQTTEGRSAANLVNAVRAGTLNQPLGGQRASGN